jgi:hypothetical protein
MRKAFYEWEHRRWRLMISPERHIVENLDEAIRRSILRLEQEQLHVSMLQEGGEQHSTAKAALERRTAALGRLRAYRAKVSAGMIGGFGDRRAPASQANLRRELQAPVGEDTVWDRGLVAPEGAREHDTPIAASLSAIAKKHPAEAG